MKYQDFDLFQDLLYKNSGLVITPEKSYLLDSRLTPIAKKWKFSSIDVMALHLRSIPDRQLVRDIAQAMADSETCFFRDREPFRIFRETVLPHMLKDRADKKTLRIWCAGCASGQEAYSLAIILKEKSNWLQNWKVEIIATDISEDCLNQARSGVYSQFEVQHGLSMQYLLKYFSQAGNAWQIRDDIRSMVKFSNFNLLHPLTGLGHFDFIFCRNVLSFFDEKTRRQILSRLNPCLAKDGFLMFGRDETLPPAISVFKQMPGKPGVYVHPDSAHASISVAAPVIAEEGGLSFLD